MPGMRIVKYCHLYPPPAVPGANIVRPFFLSFALILRDCPFWMQAHWRCIVVYIYYPLFSL